MSEYIINCTVGRSPENAWRRENLLKCPFVETKTSFDVTFQYVEHYQGSVQQIKLIYHILK